MTSREPARRGLDQRAVRRHNLGLVVRHIARQGARSRATIAAETGLNKATVSSLVDELIERGLLVESSPVNLGSVGRPARGVQLAGDGIAGVGLEVGEHHLTALAVDFTGVLRHRTVVSHDNRGSDPREIVGELAGLAVEALDALKAQQLTPVGVTVALPGLVDISRGILFVAPNLGWSEVPVADLLRERLGSVGFPIRADNDANLGALRELWEGVGRQLRDFVYLYGEIGTGVGAGIVVGAELFRGRNGFGGELGHMRLTRRGRLCSCGSRGCLEVLAGWDGLRRLAGLGPYEPGEGRDDDARQTIIERARRGESRTMQALSEIARWLSMSLASAVNLLNPQAVVLGGYYAEFADWLVPRIKRELAQHVLGAEWSTCPVLVSDLGGEAAVRGAAALSLHEVLADPAVVGRRPLGTPARRRSGRETAPAGSS